MERVRIVIASAMLLTTVPIMFYLAGNDSVGTALLKGVGTWGILMALLWLFRGRDDITGIVDDEPTIPDSPVAEKPAIPAAPVAPRPAPVAVPFTFMPFKPDGSHVGMEPGAPPSDAPVIPLQPDKTQTEGGSSHDRKPAR